MNSNNKDKKILSIENLQFYWRLKKRYEEKNIVPDFLPFELFFDEELQLLYQKCSPLVNKSLHKVYKEEANIGNVQESNDWGTYYAKDFYDFIKKTIDSYKNIKKVLEIGCGSCILLEKLKNDNYTVLGIDPSLIARIEGERRNVNVILDFYPSIQVKGVFDLIYHCDVLEHMDEPLSFLQAVHKQLRKDGIMILTIPDNTHSIKTGDISMLFHQHINYFDDVSLRNILEVAGFTDIVIEKSSFGGSLNCSAKKGDEKSKNNFLKNMSNDDFIEKNSRLLEKLSNYITSRTSNHQQSIGFYGPIRVLPYLATLNITKDFRLFDDTSSRHEKFFDGIPIKVENFDDIIKNPPTDILIMSLTFGNEIEKKIRDQFGDKINVKKLVDFLEI